MMNLQKRLLLLLIGASLLALTGCNAPVTPAPQPTLDVAALKQEIMTTLVAQMTADAPKPTATPQATATLELSPTPAVPTFTPIVAGAATSTPLSTFTAPAVTTRYPAWTKTLMLPTISVGEETTVVADFRAPTEPGNYVSYWRLYNDDKVLLMKFNFAFSVK